MEDLNKLYLAIQERMQKLKQHQDDLENPLLIELRLDIEQCIALLCRENNLSYDGFVEEQDTDQVIEELWSTQDDEDKND